MVCILAFHGHKTMTNNYIVFLHNTIPYYLYLLCIIFLEVSHQVDKYMEGIFLLWSQLITDRGLGEASIEKTREVQTIVSGARQSTEILGEIEGTIHCKN